MDTLLQDIRYAARRLARARGFAAAATVILAIGIAATATIFSLANALLLRPLALAEPQRLVTIHAGAVGGELRAFSYPDYLDLRRRNAVLSQLAAISDRKMSLRVGAHPELALGLLVSGNYFSVLGVRPAYGRFFLPDEDATPGTHPVAVISFGLWQRRFGGDPGVLGRVVGINGHPFTIVGVAPRGFTGTFIAAAHELWVPMMTQAQAAPGPDRLHDRAAPSVELFGRLAPGVSLDRAQRALTVLHGQLRAEYPDKEAPAAIAVLPLTGLDEDLRGPIIVFVSILLAAAGLVLLIACVNVAGLLLTRAIARQREIAIRLAIGASRARLVRQLLVESLLLFSVAGAVGLALTFWSTSLLLAFHPPFDFQLALDLGVDVRVVGFTMLIALATGIGGGLAPALQATRPDLVAALKEGTRGAGSRRSRLRDAFVIGQVATSLLLLVGAGLFLRALHRAGTLDPGFDVAGVEIATMNVAFTQYDEARGRVFYRQLVERLRMLPGVEAVSLTRGVPLRLGHSTTEVRIPGREAPPDAVGFSVDLTVVTPKYFETLRLPIVAGRDFDDRDGGGALPVAIVSQAMAERFWPGQDAVGRRFTAGEEGADSLVVVGVARNAAHRRLGETPRALVYLPFAQSYSSTMTLLVRSAGAPDAIAPALRREISSLEPDLPVSSVMSLREFIGIALLPQRMAAAVASSLGLIGLVLAVVGIFSVVSHAVGQRTREIGIRVALGAAPHEVLSLVIRQGMTLTLVGVAVGLALALATTRFLSSFLLGVSPADLPTFAGIAFLLAGAALLASYLPARRASRIDPLQALRET